jgi:hypothetical protein
VDFDAFRGPARTLANHAFEKRLEGAAIPRALGPEVRGDEEHDRATAQRGSDGIRHLFRLPRYASPATRCPARYGFLIEVRSDEDVRLHSRIRSSQDRVKGAPLALRVLEPGVQIRVPMDAATPNHSFREASQQLFEALSLDLPGAVEGLPHQARPALRIP